MFGQHARIQKAVASAVKANARSLTDAGAE